MLLHVLMRCSFLLLISIQLQWIHNHYFHYLLIDIWFIFRLLTNMNKNSLDNHVKHFAGYVLFLQVNS